MEQLQLIQNWTISKVSSKPNCMSMNMTIHLLPLLQLMLETHKHHCDLIPNYIVTKIQRFYNKNSKVQISYKFKC